MGVCKCKQRNVTNQFCYVCRMNVCESCMVKDHQRCIIKSYVHWLQDSDFSATCSLCLDTIDTGEVVRLTCYDLFHWDCLNAWALKFPENTPITSYQCPDCKAQLFPPSALVSPVADVIRQRFATVAWGRRGLGLPSQHKGVTTETTLHATTPQGGNEPLTSTPASKSSYKPISAAIKTPFVPLPKHQQQLYMQEQQQHHQQQQNIGTAAPYNREKYQSEASNARKVYDTTKQDDEKITMTYDHDDNKYKRKGFKHWIGNMLNLRKKPSTAKKEANLTFKRMFILLILFAITFMTIIYFMSSVGRSMARSDPMLDPNFNPHIKVAPAQQLS